MELRGRAMSDTAFSSSLEMEASLLDSGVQELLATNIWVLTD